MLPFIWIDGSGHVISVRDKKLASTFIFLPLSRRLATLFWGTEFKGMLFSKTVVPWFLDVVSPPISLYLQLCFKSDLVIW